MTLSKGKLLQVDGWKSWKFNKDGERVFVPMLEERKSESRKSQ